MREARRAEWQELVDRLVGEVGDVLVTDTARDRGAIPGRHGERPPSGRTERRLACNFCLASAPANHSGPVPGPAYQHGGPGPSIVTQDLAKKLSNPSASPISVPFRFNSGKGYVNIQPVIPFSLNDDWNVISRTILPFAARTILPGPPAISSAFLKPSVSHLSGPAQSHMKKPCHLCLSIQ